MRQCQSPKFTLKSACNMRNTLGFPQGHISVHVLGFLLFSLVFKAREILDNKKWSTIMCLFSCFALDGHRHLCLEWMAQVS